MPLESQPYRVIFEAEWNDIPCVDYPLTPEKWVSESIRPLAGTQVDCLFYNFCSSDGFVCALDSGPILMDNFEKLGDAWVWRYRENTKRLVAEGANPPDLAVEYGHALGIKVAPIVRMNDQHDMFFKYEVSQFKFDNPHLLLGHGKYVDWEKGSYGHPHRERIESFTWGMFDFAHAEVRARRLSVIEEFLTRWDQDGVCLDFDRAPWFFQEEGRQEDADLMTELLVDVRRIADEQAARRGHPMFVHVRVLPTIEASHRRGLDVRRWVEEGLVDGISPGAGYLPLLLDLGPWLKLVEDRPCWIHPCNNHWKTVKTARAWAKLMDHRGAHGYYLFNWGHLLHGFDENTPPQSERLGTVWMDELHPDFYQTLHEIADPHRIAYGDALYDLEAHPHGPIAGIDGEAHRHFRGIDAIELPVTLTVGTHTIRLPFAEDLAGAEARGFTPQITLRLKLRQYTFPDDFDVSLNGILLDPATRTTRAAFIMDNDTWMTYPVHGEVLNMGDNTLTLTVSSLNPQMDVTPSLENVELEVAYRGA